MRFGLCCASCRADSLPRPTLPGESGVRMGFQWLLGGRGEVPPVMKITFPERSGMSFEGVKDTLLRVRRP